MTSDWKAFAQQKNGQKNKRGQHNENQQNEWIREDLCNPMSDMELTHKYVRMQFGAAIMENGLEGVLEKWKTELPYDPAILFLGNIPRKWKQDLVESYYFWSS